MVAVAIVLLALTRAEIIERMRAPVVTQASGLVQVYAGCPEDMRREYQSPVARFAAETVAALYRGLRRRPERFQRPGIIVHIGDVRTNLTDVVARASTNGAGVVTRIYLKSPGFADLSRFRLEVVKAFYRGVEHRELSDAEAVAAYRSADPALRIADERARLEDWLRGRPTGLTDEEGLALMRKIIEPGKASPRDVLVFASRLFLYPPGYDLRFAGSHDCLSFREALALAGTDPRVRLVALVKSREIPLFGGGRGESLAAAADAYRVFLEELAKGDRTAEELRALLDAADVKLNVAYEEAGRRPFVGVGGGEGAGL